MSLKIVKIRFFLLIFIWLLAIVLPSYSQTRNIIFPIEKQLTPTVIKVEPMLMSSTLPGIVITGNKLIFCRMHENPLFIVFEIPSGRLLGKFGKLGKGPDEFESPEVRMANATSDGFKLFDIRKGLIFVDISKFSETNKSYIIRQIKLSGELYILNDAIQLNDSLIIGWPEFWKSKKMYVKYNLNSNQISYFGDYPAFCNDLKIEDYWGFLWRHTVGKPDGTKFVSFFDNFRMFRLYNSSGLLIKNFVTDIPKNFLDPNRKNSAKTYYNVVRTTNKYIYALLWNNHPEKRLETIPSIEVWDWNGNPIAKLIMNNPVLTFDVSGDNKKLYCTDYISNDKIYMYNLDDVF